MAKPAIEKWYQIHHEGLRKVFAWYCKDTGTAQTEENFERFARGMYRECR